MKSSLTKNIDIALVAASLLFAHGAIAQPAASPLDIQGLDQVSVVGIRTLGMGGASVANANDAAALFSNPAALSMISTFEIRGAGLSAKTMRRQTQEWVPFRPLPGLSALFEGLTGPEYIKPPDSLGIPGLPLSPWTSLQRPYDDIKPNWERNSSVTKPLSLVAALPVSFEDLSFVAAVGFSQAMDLDHFYQNNNAMSPFLGQQRPDPKYTTGNDTVHVKWYQYSRMREGTVYGITPGISFMVLPGLRIGGSVTFLTGSSDDNERRLERGHINIAVANSAGQNFMLDTVYYQQSKTGTSTYTGQSLTFGLHFQQSRYAIGLTIKPSMTLTRTWDRQITSLDTTAKSFPVRIDSVTSTSYHENGKDKLNFPLAYAVGIVLTPTDKWTIAFDYEVRSLADMELTSGAGGIQSRPWVNSHASIRLGAEFRPWSLLALRGGYRDDTQAFSPDGSAIIDEPAKGAVYSLGVGVTVDNIVMNIAYEFSQLKYQDIYQSNVTYNRRDQHRFMMELAYQLF